MNFNVKSLSKRKIVPFFYGLFLLFLLNGCSDTDKENTDEEPVASYTIIDNITDNLNAILTSDGQAVLYGKDNYDNTIIQVGKFLENSKTWSEQDNILIGFDPTGMPAYIVGDEFLALLKPCDNNKYEIIYFNDDGSFNTIDNVELNKTNYSRTRASSNNDGFGWTLEQLGNSAMIASIIAAKNGGIWTKVSASLGLLGGMGQNVVLSGTGDLMGLMVGEVSALVGAGITLAAYLHHKSREYQLEHLGDWSINIISANQVTRNECEIIYSIAGINPQPKGIPRHRVLIKDYKTNKYIVKKDIEVTYNGKHGVGIDNLESGEYTVEIFLYDKCCFGIGLLTYPAVKFLIADVAALEPENVKATMATLSGNYKASKDQQVSEYGICYSSDNKTPTIIDQKATTTNVNPLGNFSVKVQSLNPLKTYYYRAYVIINGNPIYSNVQTLNLNFPVGTWMQTLYEVVDDGMAAEPEVTNRILVFLENGQVGEVRKGQLIIPQGSSFSYNKQTRQLTTTYYDDEDQKVINQKGTVNFIDYGFQLKIHHNYNDGHWSETTTTYVEQDNFIGTE